MDAIHTSWPGYRALATEDLEAGLATRVQAPRVADDSFERASSSPQTPPHWPQYAGAARATRLQIQADHTTQQVKIVLGNTVMGATIGSFFVAAMSTINSPCKVIACATLRLGFAALVGATFGGAAGALRGLCVD